MADVRSGTVTFLFSDIEGSTRLWQASPETMASALAVHDDLLRSAISAHHGETFKHTGDGICAAFPTAADAAVGAIAAQRSLAAHQIASGEHPLRVRMGIHTGDADRRDGDYFGTVLNRTARIMGIAHGGQVVVSSVTAGLLADDLPEHVELVDLGHHRLRDLSGTEHIHQLATDDLPRDFPPLRSLDTFRHNLPVQRTSFIGREQDVADVIQRFDHSPLVTLTGIGGSGKTRLALAAAAQVLHRYPDGASFVDLSTVTDGDLVEVAVIDAVGLRRGAAAGAGGDALSDLLGFLARRSLLLVLDNCEHVVDDCADLVDEVLGRTDDIHVLATSREPLGVEGEQTVRVSSLSVDGPHADAAQLFVERATAIDGTFEPGVHDDAITLICRRLDGIPLAIELAAGQVAHLNPGEIAARLDDRFELLTGGRRRVQRQQTLAATLDWSHDLLAPVEQVLLRRLAVFTGPFKLDDAEAVVVDDELPSSRVLRVLAGLVEKSMVAVADSAAEATRYLLLETVRLYAADKLSDSGESAPVRDRHRDHYLAIAGLGRQADIYENDAEIHRSLRADLDQIRAALEWARSQGRSDLVAEGVAGLSTVYWTLGLGQEGLEWADEGLRADGSGGDIRALLHLTRARSLMLMGELLAMGTEFRAAHDAADDDRVRTMTLAWWGFGSMHEPAGIERCEAALDLARRLDDEALLVTCHFMLGGALTFHLRLDDALAAFDAACSRPLGRSLLDDHLPSWRCLVLGLTGDARGALRLAERLTPNVDSWWSYGREWTLGILAAMAGDRALAVDNLRAAVAEVEQIGVQLADRDLLLMCVAVANLDRDFARVQRLLGTIRGTEPFLALRSPPSFALYRHYGALAGEVLGEGSKEPFDEGRRTSFADTYDAEIQRLIGDRPAPDDRP